MGPGMMPPGPGMPGMPPHPGMMGMPQQQPQVSSMGLGIHPHHCMIGMPQQQPQFIVVERFLIFSNAQKGASNIQSCHQWNEFPKICFGRSCGNFLKLFCCKCPYSLFTLNIPI